MNLTTKSRAQHPSSQTRSKSAWVLVSVILSLNLLALSIAWHDRSFGAAAIAIVYGPIGNVLLTLVALVAIPLLRRIPGFSLKTHLVLSFGLPAAAAVADYFLIISMGLHGC